MNLACRQPHPHLHAPRRRGRDPPRRHEPGAQDAPADRGLRGVDELNAQLGVALATDGLPDATPRGCAGSRTTCSTSAPTSRCPPGGERDRLRVVPAQVAWLEERCDEVNATLAPLKSFVLPGGTRAAAQLHVCRTVCRRAERRALAGGGRERRRSCATSTASPTCSSSSRAAPTTATSRSGSRAASASRRGPPAAPADRNPRARHRGDGRRARSPGAAGQAAGLAGTARGARRLARGRHRASRPAARPRRRGGRRPRRRRRRT